MLRFSLTNATLLDKVLLVCDVFYINFLIFLFFFKISLYLIHTCISLHPFFILEIITDLLGNLSAQTIDEIDIITQLSRISLSLKDTNITLQTEQNNIFYFYFHHHSGACAIRRFLRTNQQHLFRWWRDPPLWFHIIFHSSLKLLFLLAYVLYFFCRRLFWTRNMPPSHHLVLFFGHSPHPQCLTWSLNPRYPPHNDQATFLAYIFWNNPHNGFPRQPGHQHQ